MDIRSELSYLMAMTDKRALKRSYLRQARLLNSDPQRVQDALFRESPDFFDAEDKLQVRYEMIRAHVMQRDSVGDVCKRFGVSRQTFYNLQEKFVEEGTVGLLPKQPGPKGPSKLTAEVLSFAERHVEQEAQISTSKLLAMVEEKFRVSFHRRTIEKLLSDLRSKKNS